MTFLGMQRYLSTAFVWPDRLTIPCASFSLELFLLARISINIVESSGSIIKEVAS